MVRHMVMDRKKYQGVPGFICAIPAMPRGGICLLSSACDNVMITA